MCFPIPLETPMSSIVRNHRSRESFTACTSSTLVIPLSSANLTTLLAPPHPKLQPCQRNLRFHYHPRQRMLPKKSRLTKMGFPEGDERGGTLVHQMPEDLDVHEQVRHLFRISPIN